MPKFTIPIQTLSPEDAEESGQVFAKLALLDKSVSEIPIGFIILTSTCRAILEKYFPLIISASKGQARVVDKNSFFSDLQKLIYKELRFEKTLQEEFLQETKNLNFPLLLQATAKISTKQETPTFEMLVFSRNEFIPSLRMALLSPINPLLFSEVTMESLNSLQVAIRVSEKPKAEVSGKAVFNKDNVRIYSQWGEFDPNSTSDFTLAKMFSSPEETYNTSLQEKQIVLKNNKYISLPVGKEFQFARKLTENQVKQIVSIGKGLTRKVVGPIQIRFSIENNTLFVTEVSEAAEYPIEEKIPLVSYLNPYKTFFPVVAGLSSGPVRKILSKRDLRKLRAGEIAVVRSFDKKLLPTLKKASAIVLDSSKSLMKDQLVQLRTLGKTTVAGEIGNLRNRVVTVDGKTGKMYFGAFPPPYTKTISISKPESSTPSLKHATSVFAKLTSQEETKNLDFDKISGFLLKNTDRAKGLLEKMGHQHKPVILADLLEHFEKSINLVKTARHKEGLTNLYLCLPEFTTAKEFRELKSQVSGAGLHRGGSFKLFAKIANPSSALNFEETLDSSLDGVIIDFYSLINTTYGKKFTLEEVGTLEDKSFSALINQILNLSKKYGIFTLLDNIPLRNQSPLLLNCLEKGLKGIIVQPSDIVELDRELARIEKQLLKNEEGN